jgi:hypothetical protein
MASSLLYPSPESDAGEFYAVDSASFADLRIDQIITAVARDREEHDLIADLLSREVHDVDTLRYRQEVFRDLGHPALLTGAQAFAEQMRQVRVHLAQLPKMDSIHQRQGWILDAAGLYCDAVRSLAGQLTSAPIASRGLRGFRDYLSAYVGSPDFTALAAETASCQAALAQITYETRIKGGRVEVSRYAGEPDYSAEIEQVFSRFQQGAVKDYRVAYRGWPGMNHVAAQITELVARLFSAEFEKLADYCERRSGFLDAAVRQFERELQFYLAYTEYIRPLKKAGLAFCHPDLDPVSKDISVTATFDLALAARLVARSGRVVTNDFFLSEPERVIVVTGPNQGGKTTFARTFGQLHHLAMTGCPVPGSSARLFVPDRIYTHFEREEDISNLSGKLEDDLIRIQGVLRSATSRSIVIMNEIFTATTLSDATFLGTRVLDKVIELDLLCVYVTFIDELASLAPTVVSMASTIVPEDPAERTYKVVRKPADGLAYALAIARKHDVTYGQLRERITP